MDYFASSSGTEHLTLAEMIERDMETEFEDQVFDVASRNDGLDAVLASCSFPTEPVMTEPVITVPLSVAESGLINASVTSSTSPDVMTRGLGGATPGYKFVKISDIGWVQTVDVSSLKPENTDPNLLVNPQTGLPVCMPVTQPSSPPVQEPPQQSILSDPAANLSPVKSSEVILQNAQPLTPQIQVVSQPPSSTMSSTITLVTAQPSVLASPGQQSVFTTSVMEQPVSPHQTISKTPSKSARKHRHLKLAIPPNQKATRVGGKIYPKPMYSYSCLIALAMKNSETGTLPVAKIYKFLKETFPYFVDAPDGWKNSVRHNLSLCKAFAKHTDQSSESPPHKGCLWRMTQERILKMDSEISRWSSKNLSNIKKSMARPEDLEKIERGFIGSTYLAHPANLRVAQIKKLEKQKREAELKELTGISLTATAAITPVTSEKAHSLARVFKHSGLVIIPPAQSSPQPEEDDNGLDSDDMAIIDTALNLDSGLSELSLQDHPWDNLPDDELPSSCSAATGLASATNLN